MVVLSLFYVKFIFVFIFLINEEREEDIVKEGKKGEKYGESWKRGREGKMKEGRVDR